MGYAKGYPSAFNKHQSLMYNAGPSIQRLFDFVISPTNDPNVFTAEWTAGEDLADGDYFVRIQIRKVGTETWYTCSEELTTADDLSAQVTYSGPTFAFGDSAEARIQRYLDVDASGWTTDSCDLWLTLANGLQYAWKLEEESGTRYDIMQTHPMNAVGEDTIPGSSAGVSGNAANFDQTFNDQSLEAANLNSFQSYSYSFFYKRSGNFANFDQFLSTQEHFVYYYEPNQIAFEYNSDPGGGGYTDLLSTVVPLDDEWVHICATFDTDTTEARFYINGEVVAEGADWIGDQFTANGDQFIQIGATNVDSAIDELYVWDRALTYNEVQTLQTTFFDSFFGG